MVTHNPDLAAVFARHEKAALAFSGGKDSLVCLDLCRPFRDKLTVVWTNTGAMFPHMVEFVREAVAGFEFVELQSDLAGWIGEFGYPAYVVPVVNSVWRGDPGRQPETKLAPYTSCCIKNRCQPMLEYLAATDTSLFLHGQKDSDRRGYPAKSTPGAKVEVCTPLWDWTDRDAFDYLERRGIELPEQYAHGVARSLECWNCTAPLEGKQKLFAYMAQRYPNLLDELKTRMAKVFLAVQAGYAQVIDDTEAVLKAARSAETRAEAPDGGEQPPASSTGASEPHADGAPT